MKFLNLFKNEKPEEGLTNAEQEIAFKIAEAAAIISKANFEFAALKGGIDNKDRIIDASLPFSFGVLVAALMEKGISWEKSPYVSVHFMDKFMSEGGDNKSTAFMMLNMGVDDAYKDIRDAGQEAFLKFINSEEDMEFKKYLANILDL